MIDRDMTAVCAMQAIISDPTELPKEKVACPQCEGEGALGSGNSRVMCPKCFGKKWLETTCARSVAIKAVRYADELIAELERTSKQ